MRLPIVLAVSIAVAAAGRAADFAPRTATYLGGDAVVEEWCAVDVAADGTVVVAGRLPEHDPGGATAAWLMGGGDGVVIRLGAGGTNVLSVSRLGDSVADMELDADGRIAVTGSFGVGLLSPDGAQLLWRDGSVLRGTRAAAFRNQTPPFRRDRFRTRVARVAAGADGTVASLQAEEKVWGPEPKRGRLYVWDREGRRLAEVALTGYKYPEDLAVSAPHKLVIVGGFNTYAADSPHMKNHPIHMPFMTAYSYDGEVRWKTYDFPAADSYAQNHYADSRVQRLAIGRDGLLYMGGYIHGGDYVWRLDPHDVAGRSKADVGYDAWSVAANMGRGIDHAYFARFDPATGDMLQSQPLLCRRNADGGGKPAQIQIRGIQADEHGNVYLSGYCEAYIRGRDAGAVAGQPVGPYESPEAFLMVSAADFRSRRLWTVFTRSGESAGAGVSVRAGTAAMVAEGFTGALLTTPNALQGAPSAPFDGYLVVWDAETQ